MANSVSIVFQASVSGVSQALARIRNAAQQAGQNAGNMISSGIQGAMKNPKMFAGVIIAATLAAPLIASVLAGAVTLAFGGAMVAGAFALLINRSEQVKAAWVGTLGELKGLFAEAATPMLPVLEHARQAIERLGPIFAGAFNRGLKIAAPAVTDFISRLEQGLRTFAEMGVLESGMRAFSDLLGQINIEGFFAQLGAAFNNLFQTVSESKEAIGNLVNLMLMMIPTAIRMVELLVKAWDGLTKLPGLAMLIDGLGKLAGRSAESKGAVDQFGDSVEGAGSKAEGAASMLQVFSNQVRKLAEGNIGASEALIQLEDAIDKASEAAKENGRTLDLNTEAGRENRSALNNLAQAALDNADAMLKSGAANEDIQQKMSRSRKKFIETAMAMGMNREEASKLADSYGLIPGEVTTDLKARNKTKEGIRSSQKSAKEGWGDKIYNAAMKALNKTKGGISSAISSGRSWGRRVFTATMNAANKAWGGVRSAMSTGASWGRRTYTATLNAVNRAWSALNSAMEAGRRWAGRVFTATFNVVRSIIPGRAHGGVIGAAGGGPRSNTVLVGEQGPELVNLAPGSSVVPHGQSMNLLRQAGGGGPQEVLLRIEGGDSEFEQFMAKFIRNFVRVYAGGDVQLAFGRN